MHMTPYKITRNMLSLLLLLYYNNTDIIPSYNSCYYEMDVNK